ncbi:high-affinity branched-chain amino acid ABC transporter permease LivM [Magnetospirillum gryphiswaldense]|uniref:ABC-type branched-chain amino acid transport system, permease component n=1 Tax=Magnetospirillum gryphiswaldense TaxID=55518 RepID=A4TXP8_9PROT|nr:high-affinity branched-chain amino acid ABC transporter permease LivM [Magnetospirillum gryphiswaldense]AVM73804.1 leucine/isoleucine/valine transporter permease subunit [Magnetospirillum gryphiswaldense MSR-1]AVM77707.1 leucine/isoleucine/valine transporter permease subunit [Magnetospirillum gryphiswaldense]CAM75405.1 ABC-type branched-chain amino acid transport system, permease component [Magnetospirillum gryphiswaldense MSR-1]
MAAVNFPRALRDGVLGAVVAAALALPMMGFRLVDSSQALTLGFRFDWVLWAALVVGIGRFLVSVLRDALPGRLPVLALPNWGERFPKARLYVGWGLAGFAIALPFLPFADRSLVDKATLVLIYVMLGWGLNIVVGLAGLLDLGFVAFYAVGAYSYALLATKLDLSFWLCLPLAGLFAAGFGVALGFPVLRLRGDYLAIVTLGFGEIIRVILQNWQDFTNGPAGISAIPRPTLFGLTFTANAPAGKTTFADYFGLDFSGDHRVIFLYFVILALALFTNLFTLRIRRLPIGRAWEALREDEIACRSLGLNPTTIKLSAFATGAMFAGFAGSFFATRQGFISPESFTFIESAVILAIVVLGGMGSQIGVVLAALLLVGLPEWFRELQQYRMLAFGGAMVLIMLWKPSGLLSHRAPTIRLGKEKAA